MLGKKIQQLRKDKEESSLEKTSKHSNFFRKKKVWIIAAVFVMVVGIATIIIIHENGYIPITDDEASGFGVTAERAKEIYDIQRAEDLRLQLLQSNFIKDALVLVNTAEASPFRIQENERESMVSVLLTIMDAYTLSDSDVQAIANLIRAALPDIEDENISIADSNLNYYPISNRH